MYSVALLVALGGVPAQGVSDWSHTGGGIPLPPVANSAFELSMNQLAGGPVIGPAGAPAAAAVTPVPGPAPARLLVRLPAAARLTIDGEPTRSQGDTRRFVSPPLEPGRRFVYVLRAEMVRDGKKVTEAREVPVRAGEESAVTLTLPATPVAEK